MRISQSDPLSSPGGSSALRLRALSFLAEYIGYLVIMDLQTSIVTHVENEQPHDFGGEEEDLGLYELQPSSFEPDLFLNDPCFQYLFNDEGQEHASGEIPQNTDDINNNVRNNGQYPSKGNKGSVPEVGMKFTSIEEIREHYLAYARSVGFPMRTRTTRKAKDGTPRSVTFVCSRQGNKKSKTQDVFHPRPTMQLGCEARVTASCDAVVEAGGYEELGFIEKDCRNYIEEFRRLRLGFGDAEAIQGYFNKMQAKNDGFFFSMDVDEESRLRNVFWVDNRCRQCYKSFGDVVTFDTTYLTNKYELRFAPFVGVNHHGQSVLLEAIQGYFNKMQAKNDGFFFSMDVDEESRLRNVFWVDNRCRQCYKSFGDVVTFDTTYLTNKYELRFAPFVGVNHHGQSVLLGCGLIAHEDTESFVWLFKTWLQCMDGVPPQGIITDQDQAMAKAISIVFPGIKHRWCLWHILNKLLEKLGGRSDKVEIMDKINDLVYDVHIITEFEQGWREMIMADDLNDNDWLAEMFFWRKRWVPCYLRTSFWAGMSSTQRSEGMNAFFDGYVHSKTTLKQFVDQYDRALRKKVEMEFQADASSFTKMIPCVTMYEMEKQLQDVYTISKFKEFQTELLGKVYCDIISNIGDTFVVEEYVCIKGFRTMNSYEVAFDQCTQEVVCTCHLFEFKGMICRHCIVVFIRNGVRFLPEKYILERWRRDVKRAYTRVKVDYDGWICTVEQQRDDL
ncbi:unnamed protein product [Cuscuta campestris]|uniref:SWIM-type domain-containing protein n=1 Tax=Cuscuta campestris TaxID=132261 RepID=A0A484LZL1_9ASTE|nr:unnamed protein product [Cuscuta campestris]